MVINICFAFDRFVVLKIFDDSSISGFYTVTTSTTRWILSLFNLTYIDGVKSRRRKRRLNFLILFFVSNHTSIWHKKWSNGCMVWPSVWRAIFNSYVSFYFVFLKYKNKKLENRLIIFWKTKRRFFLSKHKYISRYFWEGEGSLWKLNLWQNNCQN